MNCHLRLKEYLKLQGYKNKELAVMLGYSEDMISRYLNGINTINMKFLHKVIQKFPNIDLNYIFK